jgi:hypothetical protein
MKLIKKGDWYCKILDFEKFKNSIGIDVPMKQMLEGYRLDGFKSCIKDDPNCILKRIGTKFLKTSLNIPEQTSEADKAGKSINEHVMNVNDIDKNGLLELYNDYWSSIEFVQTWSEAELKWYMNNTKIKTLVFKWGKLGALTYYIKTIESKKSFKIAWIDNGNINDLSPREQLGLVNILLSRAKDDGCVIAVLPRLGYLDKKPFIQSGFIPYPRKFEIHGVILSSQLDDIIQLKRIYSVIR